MRKSMYAILAGLLAANLLSACGQPAAPGETRPAAESSAAESSAVATEGAAPEEQGTAEAAPPETETSEAEPMEPLANASLEAALAAHDTFTDDFTVLNGKAAQRQRSSWHSNLTAEEEQAVLDSMNENFKKAVLEGAYEGLKEPVGWNYDEVVLSALVKNEVIPKDQMDAYLLARALFADSLAGELREAMQPAIDRFLKDHPEIEPAPGMVTEEAYDGGVARASAKGAAYAMNSFAAMPAASSAPAAPAADAAEAEAVFREPADEPAAGDTGAPADPDGEFNTAEYKAIRENPFRAVAASPLSTFSIDVDTAGFTKVKYDILDGYSIEKDEVKIEELINYFNFDYGADRVEDEPFIVSTEYTVCPWNTAHRLVRIGIKADDVQEKPDTNFVLVTDVSGSMMIINKLPLALSAYADMLEEFDEKDSISLIYYASGTGVVLENAPCSDKDRIYSALARVLQSAGGGTYGSLGLNTAYEMAEKSFIENGVNRVIIATDGDFNIGQTSEGDLKSIVENGRKKGIYLTILGYGSENLKDNKMETMAENGNGNYHYIGDMADARKALVQESAQTLIPMADDVKIQVEFNPEMVKEYRLIGYESRILNAEDFNNDKVDAGEVGAGKSVTALYEVVPAEAASVTDAPELKYSRTEAAGNKTDVCTVAIRYKDVNSGKTGSASRLIEKPVLAGDYRELPDNSTALAISLAEFGMVLRESEHRGTATLAGAEAIARAVAENTGDEQAAMYADLIGTLIKQSR